MDILTTRYERMNMSEKPKKFEKKNLLYLVIAGLALVIIILLASWVIISNNSGATTEETGTTAKVSSSASSASSSEKDKFVSGVDYKEEYLNKSVIRDQSTPEMAINNILKYESIPSNATEDVDSSKLSSTYYSNFRNFKIFYMSKKNLYVAQKNGNLIWSDGQLHVYTSLGSNNYTNGGLSENDVKTTGVVVYQWTNLNK